MRATSRYFLSTFLIPSITLINTAQKLPIAITVILEDSSIPIHSINTGIQAMIGMGRNNPSIKESDCSTFLNNPINNPRIIPKVAPIA